MANAPKKSLLSVLLPRLSKSAPQRPTTAAPAFQAVSIQCTGVMCPAAKQLSKQRFLARSAPGLPLAQCTTPGQCHCKYAKYRDRRSDLRRLNDVGLASMLFDGKERRGRKGRRATD